MRIADRGSRIAPTAAKASGQANCGSDHEGFEIRNPRSTIRNVRGFTLIELTVVMVILGVMLAMVIPRLGELGEANLRRSARHLTGMIRFLRDEAQAKKTVYRLRFDIQAGRYWAEVLTPVAGEQTVEFKQLYSDMASEGNLSGQTTFLNVKAGSHPDEPYIQFTPDGWIEQSFIYLKDGEDRPFTLIVPAWLP